MYVLFPHVVALVQLRSECVPAAVLSYSSALQELNAVYSLSVVSVIPRDTYSDPTVQFVAGRHTLSEISVVAADWY
jgi:hypothetical protein